MREGCQGLGHGGFTVQSGKARLPGGGGGVQKQVLLKPNCFNMPPRPAAAARGTGGAGGGASVAYYGGAAVIAIFAAGFAAHSFFSPVRSQGEPARCRRERKMLWMLSALSHALLRLGEHDSCHDGHLLLHASSHSRASSCYLTCSLPFLPPSLADPSASCMRRRSVRVG